MNSQIFPLPNRGDLDIGTPLQGAHQADRCDAGGGRPADIAGRRAHPRLPEPGGAAVRRRRHRTGPAGATKTCQQALATQFGHASLLPDSKLSSELVAVTQPDSEAVEHLRALRSQLMLRWFENDNRQAALAVVSPGTGEGRSYITANLAVLFSQLGKRTLLIDADLRRPRQHKIFGLPGRTGLSAVLAGRAGWEALTEVKSIPSLWVLPAGAVPPNPQELLARPGFAKLITALRSSYEVILIDTPAAAHCADAGTIAARAGAALMLACRDKSSMPGLSTLGRRPAPVRRHDCGGGAERRAAP